MRASRIGGSRGPWRSDAPLAAIEERRIETSSLLPNTELERFMLICEASLMVSLVVYDAAREKA